MGDCGGTSRDALIGTRKHLGTRWRSPSVLWLVPDARHTLEHIRYANRIRVAVLGWFAEKIKESA